MRKRVYGFIFVFVLSFLVIILFSFKNGVGKISVQSLYSLQNEIRKVIDETKPSIVSILSSPSGDDEMLRKYYEYFRGTPFEYYFDYKDKVLNYFLH